MDKASASGAGDSRFESWAGHLMHLSNNRLHRLPRSASMAAATAIIPCGFQARRARPREGAPEVPPMSAARVARAIGDLAATRAPRRWPFDHSRTDACFLIMGIPTPRASRRPACINLDRAGVEYPSEGGRASKAKGPRSPEIFEATTHTKQSHPSKHWCTYSFHIEMYIYICSYTRNQCGGTKRPHEPAFP